MSADDQIPPLEALAASLTRAISLCASKCPEAVPHIAKVLEAIALIQLDMAQFKAPKQQKLEQMAILERKLASCDAGERKRYIMDCLDISESTYHDYQKILRARSSGDSDFDSEDVGVTTETEDVED